MKVEHLEHIALVKRLYTLSTRINTTQRQAPLYSKNRIEQDSPFPPTLPVAFATIPYTFETAGGIVTGGFHSSRPNARRLVGVCKTKRRFYALISIQNLKRLRSTADSSKRKKIGRYHSAF